MKNKINLKIEVIADIEYLFGSECGGVVPYHLANEDDAIRLVKDEIETLSNETIKILSIDITNEDEIDDNIQLEMEIEELSKQNTDLTNRITELLTVKYINCWKCGEKQEDTQRFCVKCSQVLS